MESGGAVDACDTLRTVDQRPRRGCSFAHDETPWMQWNPGTCHQTAADSEAREDISSCELHVANLSHRSVVAAGSLQAHTQRRCRQQRIGTPLAMIAEIFVAQAQQVDALSQKLLPEGSAKHGQSRLPRVC
jgi:hypothetical protein